MQADVDVIIETPSGSRTKYAWDPESQRFLAKKVLPLGLRFPFDFGFIPDTKADDGDPVDALVLADEPLQMGCVVACRVLGAIEAKMTDGKRGKPERNDRLVVVPTFSLRGAEWRHLADLGKTLIGEITDFLGDYVEREGRRYELIGRVERARALRLVKRTSGA